MKYLLIMLMIAATSSGYAQLNGYNRPSINNTYSSGSSIATPGGVSGSVQYNDGANGFGGTSGLTFNPVSGTLSISGTQSPGQLILGSLGSGGSLSLTRGSNGSTTSYMIRDDLNAANALMIGNSIGGGPINFYNNGFLSANRSMTLTATQGSFASNLYVGAIGSTAQANIHVNGSALVTSWTTLNSTTAPIRVLTVASLPAGAGTNSMCYDTATGAVSYGTCSVSDISQKKQISTYSNGLSDILKLRPATYRFIDEKYGTGQQIGLIAQEVDDVFPSFVRTEYTPRYKTVMVDVQQPDTMDEDGNSVSGTVIQEPRQVISDTQTLKSINYASLVVPLISAVQELEAKVRLLEEKQALIN